MIALLAKTFLCKRGDHLYRMTLHADGSVSFKCVGCGLVQGTLRKVSPPRPDFEAVMHRLRSRKS